MFLGNRSCDVSPRGLDGDLDVVFAVHFDGVRLKRFAVVSDWIACREFEFEGVQGTLELPVASDAIGQWTALVGAQGLSGEEVVVSITEDRHRDTADHEYAAFADRDLIDGSEVESRRGFRW